MHVLLALSFAVATLTRSAIAQKCLPGQPCFPSQAQLSAFNTSVAGALLMPPPYGQVCYQDNWNAAACAVLVENKTRPEYRESLPAAVQYTNNEFNDVGQCVLGNLVNYAVNATTYAQVVTTVKFAALHNLNLVIKNTGHDYLGRSTDEGGFSIWTEHLKDISHVPNFAPAQCKTQYDVVEAGAGNNVGEIYAFADANNVLLNGGYNPTVGACGGYWTLGGIGSPFGPVMGYGVDRIAQFEIVLANGTVQIASQCQNPDLYWAVKGGGAAFGVVTRVWILTYPKPQKVNIIFATLEANSSESYTDLANAMVDQSPKFRDPGTLTSCLVTSVNRTFELLRPKIFNASETVVSANQSAAVFDPVRNVPGVKISFTNAQFDTWYEGYEALVKPIVQVGAPVGISIYDSSRALNSSTLYTSAGRQRIKDFLAAVSDDQVVIFEWNGGYKTTNPTIPEASINPVWRDAVGYLVPFVSDPSNNGPSTAAENSTVDALSSLLDKYIGYSPYPKKITSERLTIPHATGDRIMRDCSPSNKSTTRRISLPVLDV